MPSEAFEPAIPALEQLHTYAIDRAATGIGSDNGLQPFFCNDGHFSFQQNACGPQCANTIELVYLSVIRFIRERNIMIKSAL